LTALSPANAAVFSANWERFARRVAIAMFGERAGSTVPPQELIARIEQETSAPSAEIGGWFADLRHVRGLKVVSDHDLWPYLAGRFGLSVIGFLEPKPGIAPTTSHLTGLIEYMATAKAQAILTTPFFEPRHARLVAERTGAVIIPLAHQIGALPGTADYIALIDRNVQALRSGLTPKP
jgi:ABC-type Zn uptake system ZnuABC Zn-binding protein ZnuA